jgi:alpha-mannosidase
VKRAVILIFLSFFGASFIFAQNPGNPKGYLKGYLKTIKGDNFSYHSPQPNVSSALLIRSMEKNLFVEWETEPVPADFTDREARFIFLAAIDVNQQNPHSWELYINDKKEFIINSPIDGNKKQYRWKGPDGYSLDFNVTLTDQFGDQHGYMTLKAPAGEFEKGKPLKLKVIGESANSQTWFMIFKYAMEPDLKLVEEQAVRREGNNEYQQVRIEYVYMGEPTDVIISTGEMKTNSAVSFGYNTIRAKLPVVKETRMYPVVISLAKGNKVLAQKDFLLSPVVKRTIHLLHHSHNDIGYTHIQDTVKQIQWRNLENAIKLASESQDFPEGARFKWNSEVMWGIESYLREKDPGKAKALRDAISKGWIEPDAFFANELTELCSPEELIQLTSDARRIAAECGIELKSAMISDIPGWSWGIVPVLAQSGVKYLSLGTNGGDRIGSTIKEWGDRPFYWVSPSGEEKVLCWIHEKGYSFFHTGLKYDELKYRLDEGKVFEYMNELYDNKYPYEIVPLRYNIGSDNGPVDPTLSQAVRSWNEKYVTPKVKIMTVSESFSEFEKRYGEEIPSISGAFTGYWEDGAASSAYETSLNRIAAAKITTAGTLMVMNKNTGYSPDKISEAWRNVLLFDEHTWGSWNSISDPENEFTQSQWATKKSFAVNALNQSNSLLASTLSGVSARSGDPVWGIAVINPHSWNISDMVTIPAGLNIKGARVIDKNGSTIPSQKLSSGEIVFVAKDVPPLGSRIFSIEKGEENSLAAKQSGCQIENNAFVLKVDSITGAVEQLTDKLRNIDLVDKSSIPGLNSYYYVSGRSPVKRSSVTDTKIEISESGSVTSIIKTSSSPKGTKSVTNYYQIINGLNKVNLISIIDKEKIYTPEGVHLGFPFNVPSGVMRLALAFGVYRPEADQVKAACKNYFTPLNWVDISNQDYGVTWVTNDAPLIEVGDITTDANSVGWIGTVKPAQTIYSYVMNNYWGTNYKAEQNGAVTFRYTIQTHGMFIPANAEKIAARESEPLIVVPVNQGKKEDESLFLLKNAGIIVTALIPQSNGYLIRLFNTGGNPEQLEILWKDNPQEVFFSDFDGKKTGDYNPGVLLPAWALRTLKVRK